jgi:hypothetical protein
MLPTRSMHDWARSLRAMARSTLGDDLGAADWSADPEAFSDERGHRRTVDAPLLRWRGRADGTPPAQAAHFPDRPDAALFAALTDGATRPSDVLADRLSRPEAHESLLPRDEWSSIEVWTETELAALHALWWHAYPPAATQDGAVEPLRTLVRAVTAWHVDEIQPDNATNHAWATHVFLHAHFADGLPGADLHAQTLTHNCMVSLGRPDRLSAHVLADAAEALEHLVAMRSPS